MSLENETVMRGQTAVSMTREIVTSNARKKDRRRNSNEIVRENEDKEVGDSEERAYDNNEQ